MGAVAGGLSTAGAELGEIAVGQSRSAAMALAAEAAMRELAAVLSKAEAMLPLVALGCGHPNICTGGHLIKMPCERHKGLPRD